MTAFLDTNVLIRHLTGRPPEMAARATSALRGGEELLLTAVILAECVFVLESFYELERTDVAESMRSALSLPSVKAPEESALRRALDVYEQYKIDFAEAYLFAQAERSGGDDVLSFDRSIDRVETVRRREP